MASKGLWANIHAKRARGERMRKKGEKGAPTADQIKRAQGEEVEEKAPVIAGKKMKKLGSNPGSYKRLVQRHLNKKREIAGIIMTMYDARLNLSKQVVDEVNGFFKNKLFKTLIHRNVRLSEAPSFGKPALLYDASSNGAKNYLSLTEEILQRVI